ncbi:glycosyltransferase [Magnetospirillum gryphiswaldense]|uniref:Beta-monoglucosyldiacylglycerol synthase n=1 Tax=Magnetospirillum gryphiswaldense TaxID=55518 RepID=A4TUT1_9PROT|nr:glycosyltransferase [Magnetospirillum gryphiswaldense]AVM74666.1 Cellulose synthase catalytic subunit [UDP-forming] [Magnetospirillum gryphiswaldense MSR-1]AVM78569.1 Cellulose synthase catalytic subunit [UDP-forming] [Magnetospirillum gryphiswaldense]CAM74388.1 beta-(1-3)-glucosyl transferase [Magnetospirillum gryphiswaldense MSR-1]
MRFSGFLVLLVIMLANLGFWSALNQPKTGLPWSGTIQSVSFSPSRADDDPTIARLMPHMEDTLLATREEMDEDLAMLSGTVQMVRTYSTLEGLDQVPELAGKHGLKALPGAWLDERLGRNEREIENIIRIARDNPNVERIIVGNENLTLHRLTPEQMIRYIRRVRAEVPARVKISTAEAWSIWLEHPELAQEVDYITIHTLPFWERVNIDEALPFTQRMVHEVKAAYPDKPLFIGEVGWPSAGRSYGRAEPSLVNQALFLRRFLNWANEEGLDYNVVEAFDQPWKVNLDGTASEKHWGIFSVERTPKFDWIGPVIEFQEWPFQAAAATLIAFLPVVWFLMRWKDLRLAGKVFFGMLVQFAATLVIWTMSTPVVRDLAPATELMIFVLLPAQLLLLVVVLINGIEVTELTWSGRLKRGFKPHPRDVIKRYPKVSLHLPCYNEPPEMVKLTLDSLLALDYPNFEVIVLDNNTKKEEVWKPVEAYCAQFPDKVKFYHLAPWPGAKAGALNFGLSVTDPEAEIIGVVDSDYQVRRDWLSSLVPYFEDPKVGHVQAPQDHRDWERDLFKEMINWEYAGFFDIGMVFRNEANAIIQHGTMTLVRKKAMDDAGKWAEWCIVEDAELGLRMMKLGYESVYIQERMGHGLVPDSFMAYKKQRFRWAYGAVQILKAHWKSLIPFKETGLTAGQKYHFVSGWLPWFADGFYLMFCLTSLFWTAGMVLAPRYFDTPLAFFILPTVGVFIAKIIHHIFLYTTRVKCGWKQRLLSAVAGMGLTYAIAWAMWQGIFTKHTPFMRTPKMAEKVGLKDAVKMTAEETTLMLAHWAAAVAVLIPGPNAQDPEIRLWAVVLVVQSMPFLAALVSSVISTLPSRPAPVEKAPDAPTPAAAE